MQDCLLWLGLLHKFLVQQQEVSVWLKGHFSSGDIILDDEVTIWGHWSDGSFVFARGVNQRTGARITLRSSKSRIVLLVTALIATGISVAIYGSAVALYERLKR